MRKIFEKTLLFSNAFTLFPVVFGLLGAIVLFIIASYDVGRVFIDVYHYFFGDFHPENFHSNVVGEIVGAIDLYLMASCFTSLASAFTSYLSPRSRSLKSPSRAKSSRCTR